MIKIMPRNVVLMTLLLTTTFIWVVAIERDNRDLTVAFLDIGQGDSIFIRTPSGRQILIDGGADKKVLSALSDVMPFYDRSIDMIVATHPDKDHIGGLPHVLERYAVQYFMKSGVLSDNTISNVLDDIVEDQGIKELTAKRGMVFDFGDGANFLVLFPDRYLPDIETNTGSVVLRVGYGRNSFMLTGDSPKGIEKYLVTLDEGELKADVLKAGHHGSKTSSEKKFVQKVLPEYVVISAGKNNRYNHPHQEITNLFSLLKIKIFGTYDFGTIIFNSDGLHVEGESEK